jgi:hypothetical protein
MYDMYSIKPLNETLKKIKEELENSFNGIDSLNLQEEEQKEFDEETKNYKKVDITEFYSDFLRRKKGRTSSSD